MDPPSFGPRLAHGESLWGFRPSGPARVRAAPNAKQEGLPFERRLSEPLPTTGSFKWTTNFVALNTDLVPWRAEN
jgi:hypothetical protein